MRVHKLFGAAFFAAYGAKTARADGGLKIPDNSGTCQPYNGTICKAYIGDWQVFVAESYLSAAEIEASLVLSFSEMQGIATEGCQNAATKLACLHKFSACTEHEVDGERYALPHYECNSLCREVWDQCRSLWGTLYMVPGLGSLIPSCGNQGGVEYGRNAEGGDRFGVSVSGTVDYYLEGTEGEYVYPEESTKWTSPIGTSIDLPCNDGDYENDIGGGEERVCLQDLTSLYQSESGETCSLNCPHPLYSHDQYNIMAAAYLVPGFIGGILCIYLWCDAMAIRYFVEQTAYVKRQQTSPVFRYQIIGSGFGLIYFLTGPLMAISHGGSGANGALSCEGASVIPYSLDKIKLENHVDSTSCVLNRGSVFLIMIILNLILVNIVSVTAQLKSAGNKQTTAQKKRQKRAHKAYLVLAIVYPVINLMVAFTLDELDPDRADYQGQLARWTIVCGPRLTLVQELALVHAPMIFSGLMIVIQSILAFRTAKRITTEMVQMAESSGKGKQDPMVKTLLALSKSLSRLGFMCAILIIDFSVTTMMLVPKVESSSNEIYDFIMCLTSWNVVLKFPDILNSVEEGGCEALFEKLSADKTSKISDLSFTESPSWEILAASFFSQGMVMLLFGAFYLSFALDRRRKVHVSGSFSRRLSKATSLSSSASSSAS